MSKKRLLEILDEIFNEATKPRLLWTLPNGAEVSGPDLGKMIRVIRVTQKVDRRDD